MSYKQVKSDIEYLVKKYKCSREQALLALMRNGRVTKQFSDTAITKLLNLSNSQFNAACASAEYKLKEVSRLLPELRLALQDVSAKNYYIE